MSESASVPIKSFKSKKEWAAWLAKNFDQDAGLWMKLAKKGAKISSITYEEALDVALCYGWIDGQKKGLDEKYWLQKFSPRRPGSIWSKSNTEKADRLIQRHEMKPPGLRAIQLAKDNGRWDAAYQGQRTISVPDDLETALAHNPKARAFFVALNSVNRYAILFRIHNAKKAETRLKRIRQFVEMLERGEMIYP